jgi:NitT/TauT family transport system permease protein
MKRQHVAPLLTFAAALGLWEWAARAGLVAEYIVPAPSVIARHIHATFGLLLQHSYVTALEIALGFGLAVVGGIGLAMAMVYVRTVESILYPWIVVSQVVPKVAIGPLLLMWLGFGLVPKVVIAFLVAFFPILVGALVGFRSVEQEPLFLLRSMGSTRWQVFWHVQVPTALPNILAGMKVAITLAVVGAIVGEFIGANVGLGYLLLYANGVIDTKLLFAALVMISALAMVAYWIVGLIERLLIPWHISVRQDVARPSL